jgi:hypothetical protein
MYPLDTTVLAGGKTILYVSLIDGSTLLPITTGAVVAQSAYVSTFYTKQIVNSAGIATLYVPNNTKLFVFTIDTDDKYQGKTTYFETGAESMDEIDWVLEVRKEQPTVAPTIPPGVQQPGAAPGVTIAPGQTYAPSVTYSWAPTQALLTPRPTTTLYGYQPSYGNFTGFWAPFENMGVAMGAQPNEVGVLMMFMLIIGFLILGGWAAGALGAEVGVVAGMVCSVAFGFLPFAISIAVIAILCLYGALRIWGVTR